MEYSILYANKRAERGDKTGLARLMPSMTATEREAAHYAAGEMSQRAIDQATADFEINQASGSSHRAKATPSSRPSTEAGPKAKKNDPLPDPGLDPRWALLAKEPTANMPFERTLSGCIFFVQCTEWARFTRRP